MGFAASIIGLYAYAALCEIRLIIPLNQAVLVFTFVVWDYKILIFVYEAYGNRSLLSYLYT